MTKKQPYKLPLKIEINWTERGLTRNTVWYDIIDADCELIVENIDKDTAQSLVDVANMFPEAVEIIEDYMVSPDNNSWLKAKDFLTRIKEARDGE